jgi:hypothetical protein
LVVDGARDDRFQDESIAHGDQVGQRQGCSKLAEQGRRVDDLQTASNRGTSERIGQFMTDNSRPTRWPGRSGHTDVDRFFG